MTCLDCRRLPLVWALACCASFVACRAEQDSDTERQAAAKRASKKRTPTPVPGRVAKKTSYDNPGGMWMPSQLKDHTDQLRRLGLSYDPKQLTDPTASPLGAIVSLGGCSASFVSKQGLLVTNHHCAQGALQYNSTPEQNLLQDGFLAKTQQDEKSVGPTGRVYVTAAFTEVTEKVLAGLADIPDPKARSDEREKRRNALVAACEKNNIGRRCSVASYFEGAQFFQIEQLELRDIRLVYAPDAGIGIFGGEVDNWQWPRHTGDFAFYRAYVGEGGKPADFSTANKPYAPPRHLKIAKRKLGEDDFVMVAGYPAHTSRLKTAGEVAAATTWYYPRAITRYEQMLAVLEKATQNDDALKIKANAILRGLNNALTNNRGMLDGLAKGGLAHEREKEESKLRDWIASDATRNREYGDVLHQIARLNADKRKGRERDAALSELARGSRLVRWAVMLHDMAEERAKADADRKGRYQQRNWARTKQGILAAAKRYDQRLDRALFKLALERAAKLPVEDQPAPLKSMFGSSSIEQAAIDAALDKLYATTELESAEHVSQLFDTATTRGLQSERDPFLRLGRVFKAALDAQEDREDQFSGEMSLLRPRYIAALKKFKNGALAPDANGTLRITYGTVRGYRPAIDKPRYRPFTVLSEMVAKHTDKEPFDAPDAVLAAIETRRFGPYIDPNLGEVPINFLADLDTTGGNSGSAAVDRDGNLVGLLFDGNYESMASDWVFMPNITRSILVDFRYVMWIADAVDGAQHLLKEMGVSPAFKPQKELSQLKAGSTKAG
ncbi:MAG: S46 family peptidase [Nannocystaceae bacterium]